MNNASKDVIFEEFVRRWQSPLRRYLFHLSGGNGALADDLAQESFIKAFLHWESRRTDQGRAWLFRIAYRTFLDHKRSAKEYVQQENITSSYAAATHIQVLKQTLECLDEKESNLIILSCIEEFTQAEIAQTTGMALGSVKTTIRRAKEKLRKHLQ